MTKIREMDATEKIAQVWLKSTYPTGHIVPEPDGKYPPDFLLDGTIAIEVRRFDQNRKHPATGKIIGLNIDLRCNGRFLDKEFAKLRSSDGFQYHVDLEITDPIQIVFDTVTRRSIKEAHASLNGKQATTIHSGFKLTWIPWLPASTPDAVILGGADDNSDGWLRQAYVDNLCRIIDFKTDTVTKNAKKDYKPWWLVLVDYAFHGTRFDPPLDLSQIDKRAFTRIVIINHGGEMLLEV